MKSTYDLVRERIMELVPELKELKFGCEIAINGLKHKIYAEEEDHYSACTVFRGEWVDVDIGKDIIKNPQRVIILGTEPELHDVLRALSLVGSLTEGSKYLINVVSHEVAPSVHKYEDVRWNLSAPLSLQSEETILFLKGLLQVEN